MRKLTNKTEILLFLTFFISFEWIEYHFKVLTFNPYMDLQFLRITLFNLTYAILLTIIIESIDWKYARWVILAVLTFFGAYAVAQLEFKTYMGNYFSWKTAGGMGGKVMSFAISFIQDIRVDYWLELIPAILFLIVSQLSPLQSQTPGELKPLLTILLCVLIHCFAYATLTNQEIYDNPAYLEQGLRELGTSRFCFRDFIRIFHNEEEIILDLDDEEISQMESISAGASASESPEVETAAEDYTRYIDDTEWIELYQNETNEDIRRIDEYLMSRPISSKNEMTGLLEGKNCIMVMVEAFDYMAINPVLTPTLYKMMNEGWYFSNYYTPKYSCTTGESEFISEVSLIPGSDICTPNQYAYNIFSESIFSLFKDKGYHTSSYHNWKDEFYDRSIFHLTMGSEHYEDVDDLGISYIQGWQSDVELFERAYQQFKDTEDPFFALMITSSTHFPYDESSTLGDKYLSEVNAVYPDMPLNIQRYLSKAMELDHAFERLLEMLEEDGLADDTYIWVYADHHPLKTDLQQIADWTQIVSYDRMEGQNIDRTPNFLYSPSLEKAEYTMTASTFDLVPTIANLFNLNYDPRFYIGTDLFSDIPALVIWPNGDWADNEGLYRASSNTFSGTINSEEIEKTNKLVSNLFKISNLIYRTDYFKYRNFLNRD